MFFARLFNVKYPSYFKSQSHNWSGKLINMNGTFENITMAIKIDGDLKQDGIFKKLVEGKGKDYSGDFKVKGTFSQSGFLDIEIVTPAVSSFKLFGQIARDGYIKGTWVKSTGTTGILELRMDNLIEYHLSIEQPNSPGANSVLPLLMSFNEKMDRFTSIGMDTTGRVFILNGKTFKYTQELESTFKMTYIDQKSSNLFRGKIAPTGLQNKKVVLGEFNHKDNMTGKRVKGKFILEKIEPLALQQPFAGVPGQQVQPVAFQHQSQSLQINYQPQQPTNDIPQIYNIDLETEQQNNKPNPYAF
jgi:hypothetical protein